MKYFNAPSVGWRKSWSESTILLNGTIPSMSYEGYCYLTQYLPALRDVLKENGILIRWFDADRIREYVRITIGSMEQLAELVDEIVDGIDFLMPFFDYLTTLDADPEP